MEVFLEISTILIITTLVAIFMRFLRQPLIVGYIITGILVGPSFLNLVASSDVIELFSKIGITILLFIVGLSLNPKVIKEIGKVSLITGVGQVVFTSIIGFFIAISLGMDKIASIYISIALTFSSTIIILKLLADRGDTDKLYGRIAIGFLIVQDVIATIILMVVASISVGTETSSIAFGIIKGLLLMATLLTINRYAMPGLSKFVAKSQELLFLFSLSWGLGLASIFYYLGFSVEIGALVAGVILSMTSYAYEVASRLKPLRDFFIILFFILLGSHMEISGVSNLILPGIILSLFVLIGNPIIVVILMNLLGFNKKIGFYAGLTVAQISEFSLILATLGFGLGHISREVLSLITFVGLVTIAGSTYLIIYSKKLYPLLSKFLSLLEFRKNSNTSLKDQAPQVILFGYDRTGNHFVKAIRSLKLPFVVIDFNPVAIEELSKSGIPYMYGDIEDMEFLDTLDLSKAKMIISSIPDYDTNSFLLSCVSARNSRAVKIITALSHHHAIDFYKRGATYVHMPQDLGAHFMSRMIKRHGTDSQNYKTERDDHVDDLNEV